MRETIPIIYLALVVSAALAGCDSSCENEPITNTLSPSGKLSAVVFNRNCGATTGVNTQLSIVQASGQPLKEAGNTFIADGSVPLKIQWLSEVSLSVSGVRGAKVFKQEQQSKGVAISYE